MNTVFKTKKEAGVAIVEFALTVPLLLFLFYSVIEITRYIQTVQQVSFYSKELTNVAHRECGIRPDRNQVTSNMQSGCLASKFNDVPAARDLLDRIRALSPNAQGRLRVIRLNRTSGNVEAVSTIFPLGTNVHGQNVDISVTAAANRFQTIQATNGVVVVGEVAVPFVFMFPGLLPGNLDIVYVPTVF